METYNQTPNVSAFIDSNDLEECLILYYGNSLDHMGNYLNRLYKNPRDLHPNNSLWGQLDTASLSECINNLPDLFQAAIENHYLNSERSSTVLNHYFFEESNNQSYDSWISSIFLEALDWLSFEIFQIL